MVTVLPRQAGWGLAVTERVNSDAWRMERFVETSESTVRATNSSAASVDWMQEGPAMAVLGVQETSSSSSLSNEMMESMDPR
jgi:hypothetical protein